MLVPTLSSREHARVELNRGTVTLVDHSSNGTYVMPDNDALLNARNDRVVLVESGYRARRTAGARRSQCHPLSVRRTRRQLFCPCRHMTLARNASNALANSNAATPKPRFHCHAIQAPVLFGNAGGDQYRQGERGDAGTDATHHVGAAVTGGVPSSSAGNTAPAIAAVR